MSSLPVGPVVVGVDGSESARAAVAWAARHASRAQLPLRIVHAFGWPLVRVTSAPSHWTNGLRAEAWAVLEESRNQAYAVDPDLAVTTDITTGFCVPLLLRESQAAGLIVVGTHGLGGFCGLVIRSTGVELAARASAPVVVIRGRAAEEVDRSASVLVGYDGSPASDLAVAAGFDYAALHDRPVLLFQVSRFGGDANVTRRMVDLAATWHLVHPEIDVSSRVASGHPGGALTE
ncbi:MAG: universal stress protein, partial [Nocardioidaceae bacterium]